MKIFAFGHRRFVGKDTAARFLVNHIRLEHNGLEVQKISFATKLKEICYELFHHLGLKSISYYEDNPNEKEKIIPLLNMSARTLWIRFGNDLRDYYPDVWVSYAFRNAYAPVILVTDLRYPDEAEAIKERNGILIRIDRNVLKHNDPADSALVNYTKWNYVIDNNQSPADLYQQVIKIVDKELAK